MSPSDLDRDLAGLLCVGFHGTSPSPEVLELIRRGVGGVILFSRNLVDAAQVAELTGALKRAAGRPLLISIDQEGGRVARLRAAHGFTELPPMRRLGDRGDERLALQVGALLGRELRAVGVDQDYAPVVDVDTNPDNPVIGDRSLSSDPERVGRLGAALARGLQSAGVAACAKHFPGHGDTSQDSHRVLPRLPHPLSRLQAVELPPFTALARAGVAAVMTAHVVFEPLDPVRPATLSPAVLRLLRETCGFEGVCVSDDLEMKGIAGYVPLEVAVPGALAAGVDQLLICHTAAVQHRAIDLLRGAVETGRIPAARLAEASRRVTALRRWAGPPPDPRAVAASLRTPEHLALARALGGEAGGALAALGAGPDPTGG
jgi:beta-N-acetylhexosaminidase